MSEARPGLPAGWACTTLRTIAAIAGGVTKDAKKATTAGNREVPYLRVANVQRGFLDLTEVKVISASEADIESLRLQPGDLLLNEGGDRDKLGRGWVWGGQIPECIHQNHVFRARMRSAEVDPVFVAYFTNSAAQSFFLENGKQTTNLASISMSKLGSLPIQLPPINEQHRIVAALDEHLSRLDDAGAALARAEAKLTRYRAAVLAAACSGRLVPTEAALARRDRRPYESGADLLARILTERRRTQTGRRATDPVAPDTTALPHLPEGWVWATVDQLLAGMTSGSRDWRRYYGRGEGTFIMAQNVRPGRLDMSFRQPVDPPKDSPDCRRSQVQPGDLLLTIVGANTGDMCIIESPLPEHYVCQSVALLRPVLTQIGPWALLWFCSPEHGKKRFAELNYGAARPHLAFDDLLKCLVAIPPHSEQVRIVAEVERHLSRADALARTLAAARARGDRIRNATLAAAFQGRLVPQDPADEPASALLARIQALGPRPTGPHARRSGGPRSQETALATPPPPSTLPRRRGRPPGATNKGRT